MAGTVMIFIQLILGLDPYYLPENPESPLSALRTQFSEITDCVAPELVSALITIDINSQGKVHHVDVADQNNLPCLVEKIRAWQFPTHEEDNVVMTFVISAREGEFYLLPGAQVLPRIVPIRYLMINPFKSGNEKNEWDEGLIPEP
jgi:hypothetical protein